MLPNYSETPFRNYFEKMGKRSISVIYITPLAHLQYAYNIGTKFQTDCLETLVGVDYTNLLPYTKALPQNCLVENAIILSKF